MSSTIRNVTTQQYQVILELVAMGFEVDIDEVADGTRVRASSRIDKTIVCTSLATDPLDALRAVRSECKRATARRAQPVLRQFAPDRLN